MAFTFKGEKAKSTKRRNFVRKSLWRRVRLGKNQKPFRSLNIDQSQQDLALTLIVHFRAHKAQLSIVFGKTLASQLLKGPFKGLTTETSRKKKKGKMLRLELNPQPVDYKACALPQCHNRCPSFLLNPIVGQVIFETKK